LVLLIEEKVSDDMVLFEVLKKYSEKTHKQFLRPLVLVISDIDGQALTMLSQNFDEKKLPVFPIKAPSAGMSRIDILDDLNSGCGGVVYSKYTNNKIKNFDGNFGEAQVVTIYPESTHFMFKDKYTMNINARAAKIKDEERKSKLTKGVGIIHIGGNTDVEHEELKEVVEDVVLATQASLKHGVIPGGGYPFELDFKFKDSEAATIITNALKEVFETLTKGIDVPKGKGVFNIMSGQWEDPKTTTILDSTLSVTEAIKNSTSLACELLATNHAIVNVRP
jgi:chaperonin GroEL